ncbi:MAG: hypothetical protein FJW29_03120 [Acidobacteria bacterium]|nr:hypothetical protein [Acidobacteriota bacterium]
MFFSDRLSRVLGGLAGLAGLFSLRHYLAAHLTLAHYDAKAHLVVARRVLDSLTPGADQIGAVWLPLPHVLQVLPVQVDWNYRTGATAIAVSLLSLVLSAAAASATVRHLTGSMTGAMAAAVLLVWNANLLYLHATPMTEPLLFATVMMAAWHLTVWATGDTGAHPRAAGAWMVAACLTRYEAWPVTGALVTAAVYARWRRGDPLSQALWSFASLAAYPIGTALLFACWSRYSIGEWFVTGGFYVPDATLQGQPAVVAHKIREGTEQLSSAWFVQVALVSAALVGLTGLLSRTRAALLVPLGLAAAVLLPLSAYLSGHPFRMRYELPLVVAGAVVTGLAVGLLRWAAPVAATMLIAATLWTTTPFAPDAPMVREAQLDRPNGEARRTVTACLARDYRGDIIFASMGSLAHYMHELSQISLSIRDFLHEGNHPMWDDAIVNGGAPYAGWMLVEEVAEGGDVIAARMRETPVFAARYTRVCEGGNVALYRRTEVMTASIASWR